MELKESPDPKNYLFSRERVPFHWDGAFHKVPSYLAFYCVEAPVKDAGGQTLFANTEMIWEGATPQEKTFWTQIELTYETQKLAHYGGKVKGPLVQRHPATGKPILRFAEAVETALNPVSLKIDGIPDLTHVAFVAKMQRKIYSPAYVYQHEWKPCDVLIADNHSLVHGRRAFEKDCPRHLRRIQLI